MRSCIPSTDSIKLHFSVRESAQLIKNLIIGNKLLFFHSARYSIAFPYQRELITFSRAAPTEAGKSLETVRSIVKRNETKGNESNSISTPIEQSSCTRLTGSDLGIAVSVFRVPGIHRRRMKREFSPRGELR